jgi:hypothetical protein
MKPTLMCAVMLGVILLLVTFPSDTGAQQASLDAATANDAVDRLSIDGL